MLGKLFKYEFKNTAKIMLTIYAILIVTTLLGTLAMRFMFSIDDASDDPNLIATLFIVAALLLYVLGIFAFLIVTYVYMCTHFYKTMYSAQGYLTHTLPVKQLTTFHVKLITSFVWTFVALLLFTGSVFFLLTGVMEVSLPELFSAEFMEEFSFELSLMGFDMGGFLLQAFFSSALSCLTYLLWVFASASIGQLFSTNKVLASVIAGIILYFVNQILSLIVMLIGNFANASSMSGVIFSMTAASESNVASTLNSSLLAQNLYSIVAAVVLYLICNVIVRRHINLD